MNAELEAFPHIIQKIQTLWGTKEFEFFVRSLLNDARDGDRAGFPMAAASELMFLSEVNRQLRAVVWMKKIDVCRSIALQKVDDEDREYAKQMGDISDFWDTGSGSRKNTSIKEQALVYRQNNPVKAKKSNFLSILGLMLLLCVFFAFTQLK